MMMANLATLVPLPVSHVAFIHCARLYFHKIISVINGTDNNATSSSSASSPSPRKKE
jgi:hypothetical protein